MTVENAAVVLSVAAKISTRVTDLREMAKASRAEAINYRGIADQSDARADELDAEAAEWSRYIGALKKAQPDG